MNNHLYTDSVFSGDHHSCHICTVTMCPAFRISDVDKNVAHYLNYQCWRDNPTPHVKSMTISFRRRSFFNILPFCSIRHAILQGGCLASLSTTSHSNAQSRAPECSGAEKVMLCKSVNALSLMLLDDNCRTIAMHFDHDLEEMTAERKLLRLPSSNTLKFNGRCNSQLRLHTGTLDPAGSNLHGP